MPLPSGRPVMPQPAATTPAAEPSDAKPKVLLADDNEDAADSLAMLLRLLGHEVRVAFDGAQALEAACAWRPEIALLDIGMPKLNGYDVARRLRQRPELRGSFSWP